MQIAGASEDAKDFAQYLASCNPSDDSIKVVFAHYVKADYFRSATYPLNDSHTVVIAYTDGVSAATELSHPRFRNTLLIPHRPGGGTSHDKLLDALAFQEHMRKHDVNFKLSLLTAEKSLPYAVDAFRRHAKRAPLWVSLDSLRALAEEGKITTANCTVDLLIEKLPGRAPIRGFASLDGPLSAYKDTLTSLRAAVTVWVLLTDDETRTLASVQVQAQEQMQEWSPRVVHGSFGLARALSDEDWILFRLRYYLQPNRHVAADALDAIHKHREPLILRDDRDGLRLCMLPPKPDRGCLI